MIIGIIRALVNANKLVYTRIGFAQTDEWNTIFDPSDNNEFQT